MVSWNRLGLWCLSWLWFLWVIPAAAAVGNPAAESIPPGAEAARFSVEVGMPPALRGLSQEARLLVVLAPPGRGEPRDRIGKLGAQAPTLLGVDVPAGSKAAKVRVGDGAAVFPWRTLGEMPAGRYAVQAVLMTNRDLWFPGAPGNWYSAAATVSVDPRQKQAVSVELTASELVDALPKEREFVRYRKIRSEVLSRFWGREMFVRVGVVLPRSWETEPARRYPLVVDIGGYAGRYDRAEGWLRQGGSLRGAWLAPEAPQVIWVTMDGAGPLGDPYQVDSENHGPYGTALVDEVLPALEHEFRAIGQPWARFTTGGSTGGWVSFALQVLYPDLFGGCWSGFPDPLDFRDFQLVNLYRDTNAFVNVDGFERPSARTVRGDVQFTMRHEVQYENVLGLGNSYTRSGGQWGAWNAAFGGRDASRLPVVAWDPRTGALNREAIEGWKRWDLRSVMEANWATLGPKLRGKLRVWVGEADEYFLNNAVHRMDAFLKQASPAAEARIEYGPGEKHGWAPRSFPELLKEMQEAADRGAPKESGREAYFKSRFMHGAACAHCKGGR
jgi:S-formylglutathione hydrolase FrmB